MPAAARPRRADHSFAPSPPAPDPARRPLAQAIERYNAAAARAQAVVGVAQDAAFDRLIEARGVLERAEKDFAEASGSQSARLVDEIAGTLSEPLPSVQVLEQRVEQARLGVERARGVVRGLPAERETAQHELAAAERCRAAAVAEVTRTSPAVHQLLTELDACRVRTASLEEVLRMIGLAGLPEHGQRLISRPLQQPGDARFVGVWREALDALKVDAETLLPGDDGLGDVSRGSRKI